MLIQYIHFPELGIEKEERKNLVSKQDYEKLFFKYRKSLQEKMQHIDTIIKMGSSNRIALMCFEKDPSFCHRGQVGEVLEEKKLKVVSL